jgi:hypothetical protein
MEMERDCHLSFLDIFIYRRPDDCLGYKVYREHTHTFYLNSVKYEHPFQSTPYFMFYFTWPEFCTIGTAYKIN